MKHILVKHMLVKHMYIMVMRKCIRLVIKLIKQQFILVIRLQFILVVGRIEQFKLELFSIRLIKLLRLVGVLLVFQRLSIQLFLRLSLMEYIQYICLNKLEECIQFNIQQRSSL